MKEGKTVNSDLLAKWTVIITNIAIVVGLAFVGLEFRNNTRSAESERIDSLTQGSSDIHKLSIQDASLSKILLQSKVDSGSLTEGERDRAQHYMVLNFLNFRRIHRAYQSGLLPDDIYEDETAGIGFAFSSDLGREVIESFNSNDNLESDTWDIIKKSAEQAQAYCRDTKNICLDRYKVSRSDLK
jgi:hypothetical protein